MPNRISQHGERGSLLPIRHINFSEGQVKRNVSSWGNRGNWALGESNDPSWNLTWLRALTPQEMSAVSLVVTKGHSIFMSHPESSSTRNTVRGGIKEEINYCLWEKRNDFRGIFSWGWHTPSKYRLIQTAMCPNLQRRDAGLKYLHLFLQQEHNT